ncbi:MULTISPECIES: glycosyltransferase family 2 protein [unclassified Paenibacillus]|uniref:glycosyltransferase family 2 protein n=1 Tax=unclassified Paenibacillus TaxID=185978 RepID=UPI000FE23F13|nr:MULTISPECIES: glycosyltransferase family 2 protein [unclassified Paenibacillus]MCM3172340.1 glycosyltransferase [Paenibacillus sp. MER 99-2]
MAIRYSIIIATYNRAHQLSLTLAAFEAQTYPKHLFEVIVADDGSTDGTKEQVEAFQASYPLTYVSQTEQRGRSAIRNLGLQHAKGSYVIFCDADFLALPEFIRTVRQYHRKHPRAVVSGFPYSFSGSYTHYYPDFSPEEKEHCRAVLAASNLWRPELDAANEIIPLITPADIMHHTDAFSRIAFSSQMPPGVIKQFASTDVAPWMVFVTRCVSVRRSLLKRVGGFNERFVLYGLEDWDLGYRLHRLKVPFYCMKEVVGYHQEHPTHFRGDVLNTENLRIMLETYGLNDSALNLLTVVPPSEDLETYKNTLRVLRRGFRYRATRSSAKLLKRTLRIAAKQFVIQADAQAYKKTLARIQRRANGRKSRTARVLRDMVQRAERI